MNLQLQPCNLTQILIFHIERYARVCIVISVMKTAKLIVRCTENCLEILRYLNEIIVQVNEMGMRVEIERIDNADMTDDMVQSLKRAGIRALPALVISGMAKPYIGVGEIKGLFEKNLAKLNNGKRIAVGGMGMDPDAPPTDLDDYWTREMTAGMKKGPKGKVEFNDNDGPVGEGQDFEKKMAEYRKKIPAHRQGGRAQEQEQEHEQSPPPRRRREPEPEETTPPPRRRGAAPPQRDNIDRSATTGDDDTDRKMMNAWMENNNVDM